MAEEIVVEAMNFTGKPTDLNAVLKEFVLND
jgi:hypothetical protein